MAARRILIILDGAAEPIWPWPSTLEESVTPALDELSATGTVARVATTPAGLSPGSEIGIPTLLGAPPRGQVARGLVEAAAAGYEVPAGGGAWRVDLHHPDGRRSIAAEARLLQPALEAQLPDHRVIHLRGHRMLVLGEHRPEVSRVATLEAHVWDDGESLPRVLDARTVVVSAPGAAAGCARMLGARVITPQGATGDVGSDLLAKTRAAIEALPDADCVVVHVGGADEAAHHMDRVGKQAMIEAADQDVVGPLATAAREFGAVLAVTSDHATCVQTGRHDGGPVPVVVTGPRVANAGPDLLHERLLTGSPVLDSPWAVEDVTA